MWSTGLWWNGGGGVLVVKELSNKYGAPPHTEQHTEDPPLRRALSVSTTEPSASTAKDEESDGELPEDLLIYEETEGYAGIWNVMDENWRTEWSKERCESVLLGNSFMNQGNAVTETAAMYLKYWKSKEWHERHQQSDEIQNGLHNGTDDAVHNGDIDWSKDENKTLAERI